MEAPLSETFLARRVELVSRSHGFQLYSKLGVEFFSTTEQLHPKKKLRLQLIRARPNFNMISDNTNLSLGIVDRSICVLRIVLRYEYHKKRMNILAFLPVSCNYLEFLASFIIPARKNSLSKKKHFKQASSSSNCYWNKQKLSIHWPVHWIYFLVSIIRSQTK